jgi:hypothetical protein
MAVVLDEGVGKRFAGGVAGSVWPRNAKPAHRQVRCNRRLGMGGSLTYSAADAKVWAAIIQENSKTLTSSAWKP